MKKSILDQFAADAINAPAVITGGCGKGGSGKSHKSKKTKTHKSKKTKSHKSGKSGGSCSCDPKK